MFVLVSKLSRMDVFVLNCVDVRAKSSPMLIVLLPPLADRHRSLAMLLDYMVGVWRLHALAPLSVLVPHINADTLISVNNRDSPEPSPCYQFCFATLLARTAVFKSSMTV